MQSFSDGKKNAHWFHRCRVAARFLPLCGFLFFLPTASAQKEAEHGTLALAPFELPYSTYVSPEAKARFINSLKAFPHLEGIEAQRAYFGAFNDRLAEEMKDRYPVTIQPHVFDGVRAEIVTPRRGPSPQNRRRVLINLHGGSFLWGDGSGGEVEAIPIASVGGFKVVTVFYRLAPENVFPAASEDVTKVYKALLRQYKSQEIGIYGCSAGGVLTAQALAWFDQNHLPMPGAIGTFCGSISDFSGDSTYLGPEASNIDPHPMKEHLMQSPYLHGANPHDPRVFPINSPNLLRKFPPTLLLTGSRDYSASSLYHADLTLSKLGVKTELHVWDGLWHAFLIHADLPESQEAYRIIATFFDKHLQR